MAPAEFWTCLKVSSPSVSPALYAQLELKTLFVGGRLWCSRLALCGTSQCGHAERTQTVL